MSTPNLRRLRIDPYGSDGTAAPDGIIDFHLPTFGYIDLATLNMFFRLNYVGNNGALSKNAESIIHILEVYVNGELVNRINYYNQVFNLLADYAFTPQEIANRAMFRNELTNGNPSYDTGANVSRVYCCKKWLGWLGCNEIVDLSKNNIHVRITIAPRVSVSGGSGNNTFTLSNIYMSALVYEKYDLPLKKIMTFDDYRTVFNVNGLGANESSIKVISDNLDYAVAWSLIWNYNTIGNTVVDGKTRYFTRSSVNVSGNGVGVITSANFKVNNKFMNSYDVSPTEAQIGMMELFPQGFSLIVPFNDVPDATTTTNQMVAFGCPIKMRLEQPEEIEVTFMCNPATTSAPVVLFVKLDKTLTLN